MNFPIYWMRRSYFIYLLSLGPVSFAQLTIGVYISIEYLRDGSSSDLQLMENGKLISRYKE